MIWLIGNKGMLGSELAQALDEKGLPWIGSDREVDITDPTALEAFATGKGIGWIVNCAAYTAVDKSDSP
jgi:dTDP-4-dehydrorhamnose reductase